MRWVPVLLCGLVAGCYMRQPLATTVPAPGTRIVAEVTDSGAAAMAPVIGSGAMEVEGIVSNASETEWTINMVRANHRDGRSVPWNRELVIFPRGMLSTPQSVVLDRNRSWLAVAATAAGALLIAQGFRLLGADSEDRGGGPPPPEH